ncbi:Uncharacterized protein Fot_50822 [Forsythia ovata]|uniref:Uncharacterized protein n=1 Tax=Forsythia ovata TaxID=205694 RepID=A0ABD1PZB2_9LAMI
MSDSFSAPATPGSTSSNKSRTSRSPAPCNLTPSTRSSPSIVSQNPVQTGSVSWIDILYKKRLTIFIIHFFMLAVVILKAFNLLCEADDKSYIKRTGFAHGLES